MACTSGARQLSNTIRGHAAEFGLMTPKGLAHIKPRLERIAADETVPALVKELFATWARSSPSWDRASPSSTRS